MNASTAKFTGFVFMSGAYSCRFSGPNDIELYARVVLIDRAYLPVNNQPLSRVLSDFRVTQLFLAWVVQGAGEFETVSFEILALKKQVTVAVLSMTIVPALSVNGPNRSGLKPRFEAKRGK